MNPRDDVIHLRRGGTSVILDLSTAPLPSFVHWGADLGPLPRPRCLPSPSPHVRNASREDWMPPPA